ncbi:MAG: DUF4446 family protein [Armatimonadetes bacterium]|nr:DUF4446 family protein [Armatimonadota bacterium]
MMLAQNSPALVGTLAALFGLTWFGLLVICVWLRRELGVVREALKGTSGERLEPLLRDHLRSKERLESQWERTSGRLEDMERWALGTVGGVGMVRYDAFDEVGGEQSFALAFQNERGDGVVINSISGREQVRVYCKATRAGKCEQTLTPEEEEAIRIARSRSPTGPSA